MPAVHRAMLEEQREAEAEHVDGWEHEQYNTSYTSFDLHRAMLADVRRNAAFRAALEAASPGRVVLDVGCGTGILSLMAARAGAERVYACEASDMAWHAHQVVKQNGLEGRVFVTQRRAEELELGERVDVLVSEWMGSFAFFESMVEAVLSARDRLLAEGGVMLPASVALLGAPILWSDPHEAFWSSSLEGFDYSHVAAAVREQRRARPIHGQDVDAAALKAEEQLVAQFDMLRMTADDLERIESPDMVFRGVDRFNGVVVWFDVGFSHFAEPLSTSPKLPPTHWAQEALLLDREMEVPPDGELRVRLTIERNSYWRRHYSLRLSGQVCRGDNETVASFDKLFPHHRFPTSATQ